MFTVYYMSWTWGDFPDVFPACADRTAERGSAKTESSKSEIHAFCCGHVPGLSLHTTHWRGRLTKDPVSKTFLACLKNRTSARWVVWSSISWGTHFFRPCYCHLHAESLGSGEGEVWSCPGWQASMYQECWTPMTWVFEGKECFGCEKQCIGKSTCFDRLLILFINWRTCCFKKNDKNASLEVACGVDGVGRPVRVMVGAEASVARNRHHFQTFQTHPRSHPTSDFKPMEGKRKHFIQQADELDQKLNKESFVTNITNIYIYVCVAFGQYFGLDYWLRTPFQRQWTETSKQIPYLHRLTPKYWKVWTWHTWKPQPAEAVCWLRIGLSARRIWKSCRQRAYWYVKVIGKILKLQKSQSSRWNGRPCHCHWHFLWSEFWTRRSLPRLTMNLPIILVR